MIVNRFIHYGAKLAATAAFGLVTVAAGNSAQAETRSYSYNARGEITASSVAGGPANGVQSTATYDAAGNRSTYQTTGSGSAPAYKTVIVVPINGLTPLIIPQ